MPNPAFLFLDTDVLVQLFVSDTAHRVLSVLKKDYGIWAVVVPEVRQEVMSSAKFRGQYKTAMRKAQTNGLVRAVNSNNFATLLGEHPQGASLVGVSYRDTQIMGERYNIRVDLGEAYTFAMACALEQPAASNDRSSLFVLTSCGIAVPRPVLRFFDLIAFAYQIRCLTDRDCDDARKALREQSEHLPAAFKNASFSDGIASYNPRLIDSTAHPVGRPSTSTSERYEYEVALVVQRN